MKNSSNKSVIILSSPGSGASLLYKYLHYFSPNSDYLLNLNYWKLAYNAVNGDDYLFRERVNRYFPYINIPSKIKKQDVFNMWNRIIKEDGPLLIDNSPLYLNSWPIIQLLYEYKKRNENTFFISFLRHPLDAITCQEESGKFRLGRFSIKDKEALYIKRIENLKRMRKEIPDIINCKYEDLIERPYDVMLRVLNSLKIEFNKESLHNSAIIKGYTGCYNLSVNLSVRRWKITDKLKAYINEIGYPSIPVIMKNKVLKMISKSLRNELWAYYSTILFKLQKKREDYDQV